MTVENTAGSKTRYALINIPKLPPNFEADPVTNFGWDMAHIHNVLIRGLNSLWNNATKVKPHDEVAFAGYALTWTLLIHSHHHGEEDAVFPALQPTVDMSHNIEQHGQMYKGLDAFDGYMKKVFDKSEKYDGKKAQKLLEEFGDTLIEHLHDEILTLSPENLAKVDSKDLNAMIELYNQHIINQPGTLTVFPFVMMHHDFNAEPNWPPTPAPVQFFAKHIAPWWHPSYWKFSSFTSRGVPQTYA